MRLIRDLNPESQEPRAKSQRAKLNLLFPCPNLPSIQFRILSSSVACFFCSLLTFLAGLPNGGPLILIPLSLHQARFSLVR
jgi:hypothetical protein